MFISLSNYIKLILHLSVLYKLATIYNMPGVSYFICKATANLLWEKKVRELFVYIVTVTLVTVCLLVVITSQVLFLIIE